jgi:thiamine biosynthesis lipoprotein
MKRERILMGMNISIEVIDKGVTENEIEKVFSYFEYIDEKFSTYKDTSEISLINKGMVKETEYSGDMKTILKLSEETKKETDGYFNIRDKNEMLDPSGIVKGWSIYKASQILKKDGFNNFCINAGGDIQVSGKNTEGQKWAIGVRSPFNPEKEIIKVVQLTTEGLATSGNYIRGQHIYNPHDKKEVLTDIVSLSVVGPNIYEADRFATAAFAMGTEGINFIERLDGFEGYAIDSQGIATMTTNFEKYVQ